MTAEPMPNGVESSALLRRPWLLVGTNHHQKLPHVMRIMSLFNYQNNVIPVETTYLSAVPESLNPKQRKAACHANEGDRSSNFEFPLLCDLFGVKVPWS
jgi:hypothetical protein